MVERQIRRSIYPAVAVAIFLVIGFTIFIHTGRNDDHQTSGSVKPSRVEIRISEDGIEQPVVKITPGSTVIWVNDDAEAHTIVSTRSETDPAANFKSDEIPSSQRYIHVYEVPGTYQYNDFKYPANTGTIVVAR